MRGPKRNAAMKGGSAMREPGTAEVFKGVVAGLAGGLIAGWAMEQFQYLVSRASQGSEEARSEEGKPNEEPSGHQSEHSEPATVRAAAAVSRHVLHHEPTQREKEAGGSMMHYGFAATMGGIYGATAEFAPAVTAGWGIGYGAGLWLASDEVAVPALGLAPSPLQHPLSTHAYALASHLVYGITVESVRRGVRSLL